MIEHSQCQARISTCHSSTPTASLGQLPARPDVVDPGQVCTPICGPPVYVAGTYHVTAHKAVAHIRRPLTLRPEKRTLFRSPIIRVGSPPRAVY
eukprot:21778-Chlamydomonas_euryale.AAC.2